ncbi:hypothetical protein JCM9533A_52740 [Catenuloplanes niger JCM 9533]
MVSERRCVPDEFHAVGDIVHLNKFNVKDGERDVDIRILHVSHLLLSVPDVQWVRILGVEMEGAEEKGPQSLFVVHKEALIRKEAEV